MAPPTGASDSTVVVGRNGASFQPHHGAFAPRAKDQSMDSNDNKLRKTLGEKWKLNRSGKSPIDDPMIEASNFMVHPDYLTKYGTLSNGVLTKSIRYAETWLYGTVGVRGAPTQRPSLFLYPGVVAPAPRIVHQSTYLNSPGPYLGVPPYPPSDRNGFVIPQPRKHAVKQNDLQTYQCTDCGKDIRTGTRCLCKKCAEKRSGTCRRSRSSLKDARDKRTPPSVTPDPYDLMRKSRLAAGEVTERSQRQKRTASASPLRRQTPTSPTFDTFKPKEAKPWKSTEEDWTNGEEEFVRRKSILECEVNAYELNNSKGKDADESSDECGEGLPKVSSKLKILRPKLNKTDPRGGKREGATATEEVRLSGQRFKIFDRSNPSTSVVEGYVSDDEECKKAKDSLTPRLPSPKRPPRRPKDKILGEMSFKYSKSKSKSSPNLSIKSILKKPCGGDDGSSLESGALECDEAGSEAASDKASPQPQQNKKQSQSTLKKKKQVQFRVHISTESLNRDSGTEAAAPNGSETFEETVHRSKSCDNLPSVSKSVNECQSGNQTEGEEKKSSERKELAEVQLRVSLAEEEPFGQTYLLKRSYSDRRPSSALVLYKEDVFSLSVSPPNAYLFNDTMALRTRAARPDTIGLFVNEMETNPERRREPQLTGNVISYEEFSKRTDSPPSKKQGRVKDSRPVESSSTPTEKKSPAPEPPPRQALARQTKPKSGAVSVVVSSEEAENENPTPTKTTATSPGEAASGPKVETEEGKILVKLSPSEEAATTETKGKRVSVTIHTKNLLEESRSYPQRKTSVLINTFDPLDRNRVTISVRNEEEPKASTCTIIETGSNSTVIPVMSTNNKTTLIVGSTPSPSPGADDQPPPPPQESPRPYIFSTIAPEVEFMDPVEAVKRNLVPHICGKEDNGVTLMERIKLSRETKEQKNLRQISQLFGPTEEPIVCQSPQFLLSCYKNKRPGWKVKTEEDSSSTTSRSDSFCSTVNSSIKNSSSNTSRSSSFRSSCYKSLDSDYDTSLGKFYLFSDAEDTSGQERDKLEYEYEIRNGFKDERKEEEEENIYETIKEEPIYDQIGGKTASEESEDDIPPPLPLTLPPSLDEVDKRSAKSIFEGASKYDILNYLVDAKERVGEECYFSGSSASEEQDGRREREESGSSSGMRAPAEKGREKGGESPSAENDSSYDLSSRMSNLSQASYSSDDNLAPGTSVRETLKLSRKSSAEIERNDSGVGSETSHTSRSKWQTGLNLREDPQHLCEDCDQVVETQVTDSGVMYAPLVCRKCSKRRSERKEIIQEIVETEEKYGRDLKIILEEFYTPMLVAGLLTPDQLSAIFLNTEELLENSEQLTEKLRDTLEIAAEQGDEDFLTVNIGKLFLEAAPMLRAFESYCTRQGAAAILLANLEKEKELLRIFLRVSQMENAVLRRMNLNSFLMVPVQRVTKYPLLLARLYKVTPPQQQSRPQLKEAQHNIELHLEHMNSEAKDVSATKVWRRFSTPGGAGRKSSSELEMINIKLRKMAVDVLDWNHEEVRFVMEGKLLYTQPTDSNWKRGRTIKLTPVFVLLVTLGKPNSKYKMEPPEDELTFPKKTGVREATLLLVKEKCGRYTLIREPLYLDKIIVCCESDADEFFEIQELSTKESFIFKAEDGERTKEWYRYLQYHAQILGSWRRRRNALANIMINGMMARACTA